MFYNYRFLIYGFLGLLFAFCFGLFYVALSSSESTSDFERNAKKLNGIFYIKENKVYAAVPSNGYYEVKDANPETFSVFPDTFNDAHIGFDDQHVFAGNMILEGLKPQGIRALGNNYYTDGEITYYCNRNSERNESLGTIAFLFQLIGHEIGWTDKPQDYWYSFVELPKNKEYRSVTDFGIAVNKSQAFFKGLPLAKSDPRNIASLPIKYEKGEDRESFCYFTDGESVYYEDQLLSGAYDATMYEAGIEGDLPSRNHYLINPATGNVFVDGHSFDPSKAPYRMLSQNLEHANQALFAGTDGIYFYNAEKEKVERAGENPFPGNQFKEFAPDIFRSGNTIYYLLPSENWSRKRGLRGRSTAMAQLKNINFNDLQRVAAPGLSYGTVWKAKNRFLYFDDLGSSQLMPSTIYEIKDEKTLQRFLNSPNMRTDDIRELQQSKKIISPDHKIIFTAVTEYPDRDIQILYKMIAVFVGVMLIILYFFRKKRIAPFLLKNGQLIITNFLFTRFNICDIQEINFTVIGFSFGKNGYKGRIQVITKDGKHSRNFLFSTKVSLMPESENEIINYIKTLQEELKKNNIASRIS